MNFKENVFSFIVALTGTIVSMFLGGWDIALKLLIFCMIADYATGLAGAIRTKTVNSEVMFWGGVRKAVIILVIALAVILDEFIGNQAPIFRTMALYFYIGREGISVAENFGVLGVPLPRFLKNVLQQLHEKSEPNEKKDDAA